MIHRIPAERRHFSDFGWLKTYWLFSFDTYHDPENLHWGTLRVFNDDVVEPGMGFPTHPHREMEIVTVVHAGEVAHEDNLGNKGVIQAGEVQRMSAGTGVTHSEHNRGKVPLHLYQIWIFPREKGLKPGYEQNVSDSSTPNVLRPLASGQGADGAVTLHADATIYRAQLNAGHNLEYKIGPLRHVFLYVTTGHLMINGLHISTKDQARIVEESGLRIQADTDSDFMLIDAPTMT